MNNYGHVDDSDGTIHPPMPADLLSSLKLLRYQDVPPAKQRNTKNAVKNIPPSLSAGKKPPVNKAPKPGTNLPSSAPPIKKPIIPAKTKATTLPAKKFRSVSDSNVSNGRPAIPSRELRTPSPTVPPVPGQEGHSDQVLLLPDLVRLHSKHLPLRVRVEEGYYGCDERFVISTGDIYNFHFVKNEKVVSVSDSGSNHFSVPFNSGIKFGLFYNPNDNFKEAIEGYTFKSVSDLVSSPTTPRIVRVLISSPKSSPAKSLVKTDLLVIRKVGRTMMKKPFMKVFSFNNKAKKTLYDDSESSFTTEPESLQLYIPEIVEHFPDAFPLKAMMYPPGEDTEDLPPHLITDIVTLAHTSIESAIIATTQWEEEKEDDDEQIPISIPIEMDIEVSILPEIDEDGLYLDTKTLLQHLDLTKVKDMKDDDVEGDGGKRKVSRSVRKGYEFKGIDITVSQKVSDDPGIKSSAVFRSVLNQPLPAPPLGLPSESPAPPRGLSPSPRLRRYTQGSIRSSVSVAPQHPTLVPPMRWNSLDHSSPNPRILRPKSQCSTTEDLEVSRSGKKEDYMSLCSAEDDYVNGDCYMNPVLARFPAPLSPARSPRHSISKPAHKTSNPSESGDTRDCVDVLRRLVTSLQEEVRELATTVQTLSGHCKQLQSQMEELGRGNQPIKRASIAESADMLVLHKTMDPQKQKENMANLRGMENSEMLHLLDVMKLTQYKEVFQRESIDGEMLAECDEELLERELHISNKLHRSRLLKVITGRYSVVNIQLGLNPYAAI